jgi:hypothetical protein
MYSMNLFSIRFIFSESITLSRANVSIMFIFGRRPVIYKVKVVSQSSFFTKQKL